MSENKPATSESLIFIPGRGVFNEHVDDEGRLFVVVDENQRQSAAEWADIVKEAAMSQEPRQVTVADLDNGMKTWFGDAAEEKP